MHAPNKNINHRRNAFLLLCLLSCGVSASWSAPREDEVGHQITQDAITSGGRQSITGGLLLNSALGQVSGPPSTAPIPGLFLYHGIPGPALTAIPGPPQALFSGTPREGAPPLTVQFTDLSSSSSQILSWLWDFGDNHTSAEQNPSHVYDTAGNYTVTLTLSTLQGSNMHRAADYVSVGRQLPIGGTGVTGVLLLLGAVASTIIRRSA